MVDFTERLKRYKKKFLTNFSVATGIAHHENTTGVDERIIIFTRYPEPGKAKTRFISALGNEGAAALQRSMTEDTVNKVLQLRNYRQFSIEIRYEGGNKHLMENWLGPDISYHRQGRSDLGKRMSRSFKKSFQSGIKRVVIVGTDIPDLTNSVLQTSFDVLSCNDAVLGPAKDGGYYLIGFVDKGFLPEAFEEIEWGTKTVFKVTLNLLEKAGRKVYRLPQWNDIDTIDDLIDLLQRNKNKDFMSSKTITFILKNSYIFLKQQTKDIKADIEF